MEAMFGLFLHVRYHHPCDTKMGATRSEQHHVRLTCGLSASRHTWPGRLSMVNIARRHFDNNCSTVSFAFSSFSSMPPMRKGARRPRQTWRTRRAPGKKEAVGHIEIRWESNRRGSVWTRDLSYGEMQMVLKLSPTMERGFVSCSMW